MTATETADESAPGKHLWGASTRATTLGILLLITIAAFEHLGVSTALPRMLAELDGGHLYSWPFTAFLSASVAATVLSGWVCDRVGARAVLMVAPAVFLAGLLVAGTAESMPVLLAARVLQGIGLGGEVVAIYVLVAAVYPERVRPAAFGLLAAAWVVPSIVGPTLAGVITERFGWRWVFLGLVPLAVLGVVLLVPALRGLPRPDPKDGPTRKGLPLAALAAALGIPAVSWAAQHPSLTTLWLGLVGLAVLVPALRTLLPRGTLTGKPGLPRVILSRGLFAGAFFGVEAFVPLTLTSVHGLSPALAGLPLTVGALGWSFASAWQGRRPDIERTTLIRTGFAFLAVGLSSMVFVAVPWGSPWLAGLLWTVCGAGMGLAFPSVNVLALRLAPTNERGFASSALQVSDMVFSAALVGLGGVLLAALASTAAPTAAVVPIDLVMAAVAVVGVLVFRRSTDERV
ncbi:MFS transporter [Actinokineospora globicatena]|uniref:MFS transporter n=1 Tax=Actinokineospora globicatena TaxID=103729 RepID=UPI0020A535DF|nr:MFS transporter [Actinokineospora globicatena]MCP2305465.1 putative arabinose efflux permease, MFS family [Actinokineospora globicatena]GLW81333.1 MFS transporter [Actinokineospora globicatena]GLW87969.1 MFS transporter [Actinokineospora globicatena]